MGGRRGGPERRRSKSRESDRYSESSSSTAASTLRHLNFSVALAVIVTSSALFVYVPPNEEQFTLDLLKHCEQDSKMFTNMDSVDYAFTPKPMCMRPMGLRWRDDARMAYEFSQMQYPVMPVLTEQRTSTSQFGRAVSPSRPTTSTYDPRQRDVPTLEDLDLIDVLWRSDIAAEKGARQVAVAEQYECDLQMLTEKSTVAPLTQEERARYEDLSKGYFEDFYSAQSFEGKSVTPLGSEVSLKRQTSTPTDEDLAELLEDVTKEGGQLDQLDSILEPPQQPLVQNVSLSQGIVYTQSNLTELEMMREHQQSYMQPSQVQPQQAVSLFNNTDPNVQPWMRYAEMTPSDVFPNTTFSFVALPNETAERVVSNGGVEYDHCYQTRRPAELEPAFDSYYASRISFSNSNDTSQSSRSSLSPSYGSESSDSSPRSRYYGKLIPDDNSLGESDDQSDAIVPQKDVKPIPMNGQRKRGRQSKDEQLASDNKLPVTAKQIAEMSLSDLQRVLKNDRLTEYQRQLIRKIRRRGKNKVAARTCRQRRNDRGDKKGDAFD